MRKWGGGEIATTQRQPLLEQQERLAANPPISLVAQAEPPQCETDQLYAAPNHAYWVVQYNCHAGNMAQFISLATSSRFIPSLPAGYFLDWSPDGQWFVFRDTESEQIWLISAVRDERHVLPLPQYVYEASFAPDGSQIAYALSAGLGLGSELGVYHIGKGELSGYYRFHQQVVASPRWSPDSSQLAYILLPDTNVPFPEGELWLATAAGYPTTLLDMVEAGRGYPPAWSPDGQSLAYIKRENPDTPAVTWLAGALHSNIYVADVPTGALTKITDFAETHVYDVVWSPRGEQLAFTAADAVWVQPPTPESKPQQVSPAGVTARHPQWFGR